MDNKRRNMLLGVLGVCVVAAGVFFMMRGGGEGGVPDQVTTHGRCLSCGAESTVTHPRDESAPHICPECNAQAVYPLYYCRDCKHRFIPHLIRLRAGEPMRVPEKFTCPACDSRNWTGYIPEFLLEEPVGDAEWPDWQ